MKDEIYNIIKQELKNNYQILKEDNTRTIQDARELEGRNSSRYDTMKIETSWLATSQIKRIANLEEEINLSEHYILPKDPKIVKTGTLITVSNNGKTQKYFMLPFQRVKNISYNNETIYLISAQAPISKSLTNKKVGDETYFNKNKIVIENIE